MVYFRLLLFDLTFLFNQWLLFLLGRLRRRSCIIVIFVIWIQFFPEAWVRILYLPIVIALHEADAKFFQPLYIKILPVFIYSPKLFLVTFFINSIRATVEFCIALQGYLQMIQCLMVWVLLMLHQLHQLTLVVYTHMACWLLCIQNLIQMRLKLFVMNEWIKLTLPFLLLSICFDDEIISILNNDSSDFIFASFFYLLAFAFYLFSFIIQNIIISRTDIRLLAFQQWRVDGDRMSNFVDPRLFNRTLRQLLFLLRIDFIITFNAIVYGARVLLLNTEHLVLNVARLVWIRWICILYLLNRKAIRGRLTSVRLYDNVRLRRMAVRIVPKAKRSAIWSNFFVILHVLVLRLFDLHVTVGQMLERCGNAWLILFGLAILLLL